MSEKIKRGLKQAVAFAKADCDHVWVVLPKITGIRHSVTKQCTRCGVRFTSYRGILR